MRTSGWISREQYEAARDTVIRRIEYCVNSGDKEGAVEWRSTLTAMDERYQNGGVAKIGSESGKI